MWVLPDPISAAATSARTWVLNSDRYAIGDRSGARSNSVEAQRRGDGSQPESSQRRRQTGRAGQRALPGRAGPKSTDQSSRWLV